MRRSLAKFSESEPSNHTPSLADFTTTTLELRFRYTQLMSYGIDLEEIGRSAGYQIGQVLNGTNPGDIPFNQATHYELAINLKTAKSLGIENAPVVLALPNPARSL